MTEMSSGKTNNNNMGLTVAWGGTQILKIMIRAVLCPVKFGTSPRLFKLGFHIPSGPCPSASPPLLWREFFSVWCKFSFSQLVAVASSAFFHAFLRRLWVKAYPHSLVGEQQHSPTWRSLLRQPGVQWPQGALLARTQYTALCYRASCAAPQLSQYWDIKQCFGPALATCSWASNRPLALWLLPQSLRAWSFSHAAVTCQVPIAPSSHVGAERGRKSRSVRVDSSHPPLIHWESSLSLNITKQPGLLSVLYQSPSASVGH